ncbi:hypothetical protein V865_002798 [Kwoniella europaea PYCC6329]|uniref:ASX DEUBAD domain-containing protein n=1 Tax=Kwoniella europaea PYCC6329 TaxID=1423913 RepID=A0AAX4KE06_9TREE
MDVRRLIPYVLYTLKFPEDSLRALHSTSGMKAIHLPSTHFEFTIPSNCCTTLIIDINSTIVASTEATQAPRETIASQLWQEDLYTLVPQSMRDGYQRTYNGLGTSDPTEAEWLKGRWTAYQTYASKVVQDSINAEIDSVARSNGSMTDQAKRKLWGDGYATFSNSSERQSLLRQKNALDDAFNGDWTKISDQRVMADIGKHWLVDLERRG